MAVRRPGPAGLGAKDHLRQRLHKLVGYNQAGMMNSKPRYLLILSLVCAIALVWVSFDFVKQVGWKSYITFLIILAEAIFLAGYWWVYARDKKPPQVITPFMIWLSLGFCYRMLTWPPEPWADFMLHSFPGFAGLLMAFIAALRQNNHS